MIGNCLFSFIFMKMMFYSGNIPNYIIYIWQGRHANVDEITASAYLAVQLDQQFGDAPVQIRVQMGKEPRPGS